MYGMMSPRRKLPVDFARGQLAGTPLCMEQYYRLFTSYRYPGLKTDVLKVHMNTASSAPEHIIVACKNQVRMLVFDEAFHSPSHFNRKQCPVDLIESYKITYKLSVDAKISLFNTFVHWISKILTILNI